MEKVKEYKELSAQIPLLTSKKKVYQIFAKIDTSYKDEDNNTVWNNIEVHSALQTLKSLVKDYYNTQIVPTLFEYEFLNELKREYNFHGQVIENASNSTNTFINAITEGFSRVLSALATKMEHKKSVKIMSDEEWLEYYIELKSSFSHTDHARHFEDYTKRNDANWQMQQQQFQRQAQEFQQQQCQQQEEMNRQMQEFQRQQEMDQQMQQQQFQQQIMSQQMQDQALQQQLLDQQQQMQQMNDNMLH